MRQMVEQVESLFNALPTGMGSKHVLVNCWRGGMRSAGVAWLLDLYGFKVSTLIGGYKSYRHWIGQTFSFPFFFHVLGGYSGSAKTYLLEEMRNRGAAVINLEYLAGHKGSAFGNIGMPKQPTQEMFENLLGNELSAFMTHKDPVPGAETPSSYEHPVWVEDESQRIGQINIPHALWNTISQSPVIFISIPFEERLQHILQEYSNLDKEKLADGITRIKKRLGGLEAKTALQYLADGDIESCFRILLRYYDKLYCKAMDKRDQSKLLLTDIECSSVDLRLNAGKILTNELLVK
jgi:tRNA 2-selenouridine synthase